MVAHEEGSVSKRTTGIGDRIEVVQGHRMAGEEGTIVAVGDNPYASKPAESYHVRFDRTVRGAIRGREIWLGPDHFTVFEKASEGYTPPADLEKPGVI